MTKLASATSALVLLPVALCLAGCRTDLLKEQAIVHPDGARAARVQLVTGGDCNGMPSVVKVPEHCVWPESARRTYLVSAVVDVVAHVGTDGRVATVRFVHGPADYDFEGAAVACAMQSEYRAGLDEGGAVVEGDTCTVSLRLERYASDVVAPDPPPIRCPVVRSLRPELDQPCLDRDP